MVSKNGIESYIEAAYLGEHMTKKSVNSTIYVNPKETSYIIGKTVIINNPKYDKLESLKNKRNHIISRVRFDDPTIEFSPYIMRVDFSVIWNGDVLQYDGDDNFSDWIGDVPDLEETAPTKLFFPKVEKVGKDILYDQEGNLTAIGWVLHQVGMNVDKKSPYQDLDLLKTAKILRLG